MSLSLPLRSMFSGIKNYAPIQAALMLKFKPNVNRSYYIPLSSMRLYNTEKDLSPKSSLPVNKTDPIIKAEFKEDLEPPAGLKLKLLLRDYGPTVMVVHIMISLTSLGIWYAMVSSGLPIEKLLGTGLSNYISPSKLATGGTFIVAYAAHKMCMPFRIFLTGLTTPLLVKFLRRKGILKPHNRYQEKKV